MIIFVSIIYILQNAKCESNLSYIKAPTENLITTNNGQNLMTQNKYNGTFKAPECLADKNLNSCIDSSFSSNTTLPSNLDLSNCSYSNKSPTTSFLPNPSQCIDNSLQNNYLQNKIETMNIIQPELQDCNLVSRINNIDEETLRNYNEPGKYIANNAIANTNPNINISDTVYGISTSYIEIPEKTVYIGPQTVTATVTEDPIIKTLPPKIFNVTVTTTKYAVPVTLTKTLPQKTIALPPITQSVIKETTLPASTIVITQTLPPIVKTEKIIEKPIGYYKENQINSPNRQIISSPNQQFANVGVPAFINSPIVSKAPKFGINQNFTPNTIFNNQKFLDNQYAYTKPINPTENGVFYINEFSNPNNLINQDNFNGKTGNFPQQYNLNGNPYLNYNPNINLQDQPIITLENYPGIMSTPNQNPGQFKFMGNNVIDFPNYSENSNNLVSNGFTPNLNLMGQNANYTSNDNCNSQDRLSRLLRMENNTGNLLQFQDIANKCFFSDSTDQQNNKNLQKNSCCYNLNNGNNIQLKNNPCNPDPASFQGSQPKIIYMSDLLKQNNQ